MKILISSDWYEKYSEKFFVDSSLSHGIEKTDRYLEEKYGIRATYKYSYYYDVIDDNKFLLFQISHVDAIV